MNCSPLPRHQIEENKQKAICNSTGTTTTSSYAFLFPEIQHESIIHIIRHPSPKVMLKIFIFNKNFPNHLTKSKKSEKVEKVISLIHTLNSVTKLLFEFFYLYRYKNIAKRLAYITFKKLVVEKQFRK